MQNELPEWCPQWAWDDAYRLASQVVAERGPRMGTFQPIVARALLDAHQRGWDEAMEAAQKAASPNSGPGIFSEYENGRRDADRAIRQLGGEP